MRAGHRRRDGDGDGSRRSCREFLVDKQTPFFVDYVQRYTDLPFLIRLEERDGAYVPGKNLTAADLGDDGRGCRVQAGADRRPHR